MMICIFDGICVAIPVADAASVGSEPTLAASATTTHTFDTASLFYST